MNTFGKWSIKSPKDTHVHTLG